MDMNKPQQRWPKDVRLMPAGWYLDPWDLTGEAMTERWWNGLIWVDRTRAKKQLPVRDNITKLPEERKSDD
jgi:hypothetical protein